jgi:hypothetical protein
MTVSTGPKISSRAMRSVVLTSVGGVDVGENGGGDEPAARLVFRSVSPAHQPGTVGLADVDVVEHTVALSAADQGPDLGRWIQRVADIEVVGEGGQGVDDLGVP